MEICCDLLWRRISEEERERTIQREVCKKCGRTLGGRERESGRFRYRDKRGEGWGGGRETVAGESLKVLKNASVCVCVYGWCATGDAGLRSGKRCARNSTGAAMPDYKRGRTTCFPMRKRLRWLESKSATGGTERGEE